MTLKNSSTLSRRDFALSAGGFAMLCATLGADAVLNRGLNDPEALSRGVARLGELPSSIGAWTSTAGQSIRENSGWGKSPDTFGESFGMQKPVVLSR